MLHLVAAQNVLVLRAVMHPSQTNLQFSFRPLLFFFHLSEHRNPRTAPRPSGIFRGGGG